jgi:hypothetical protein
MGMKILCAVLLLLSSAFVLAQDSASANGANNNPNNPNGQVTVRGCVSRASGDYILMKTDPAVTYELQATGKTHLKHYLGQRVEVTGTTSPTLSTSSDANRAPAAPVTLNIGSIKTLDKDCSAPSVSR